MTKKSRSKKASKATSSSGVAGEPAKKSDELDMLDDIKNHEDLYISDTDVTNISNFIRTTNKSFKSLGDIVVDKLTGRCSLGILHALISLFDAESKDREDVIRRLNIIYIVWRLPDIEAELRVKPLKTMQDVYSHPFSTFLYYAVTLEHDAERTLAKIIVTNNVNVVEKLTTPDFIQKHATFSEYQIDREAIDKYETENTDHWPEITDEMVPVPKAIRELGRERKEYEAGMAAAFCPLQHFAPTLLPPRMRPLLAEQDPMMKRFRDVHAPENAMNIASILYSNTADKDIQQQLLSAFQDLQPSVQEYQAELFSGMTAAEQDEAKRIVTLPPDGMAESEDSDVPSEDGTDSEEERIQENLHSMATVADLNDKTIEGCVDRILSATTLASPKTDLMVLFVKNCNLTHPQYLRLLKASEKDDNIIIFIKTNAKFTAQFLVRNAICETNGCELFKRYMRIAQRIEFMVQAMEVVIKLAREFTELKKMTAGHREAVINYIRHCVKSCEDSPNPPPRSIRLIAMLVRKLLRERVLTIEDVTTEMKPFCLKFTDHRECSSLYKYLQGIPSGPEDSLLSQQMGSSSSGGAGSSNQSIKTLTTTKCSTGPNATTTTTTTTTVVKQCGSAVVKQTSRKVVLQASSLQKLNSMRKVTTALLKSSAAPGATQRITASRPYVTHHPASSSTEDPDDDPEDV